MKPTLSICAFASIALGAAFLRSGNASAQEGSITQPRSHTLYSIDIEPHLAFGFERYHYYDYGYGAGVGPGARFTFMFSHDALVPEINNSVGVGVGLDLLFHDSRSTIQIPVVMQWNFYFHKRFSAFFEPGLGFGYTFTDNAARLFPVVAIGAQVHISSKQALVIRLGYPSASLGLSFFF